MNTKTDQLVVLAHSKAMRRHSKHVEDADMDVIIRLPGDPSLPAPGVHLVLTFANGATQRVIIPAGRSLAKLQQYVNMAMAGMDEAARQDRERRESNLRSILEVRFQQGGPKVYYVHTDGTVRPCNHAISSAKAMLTEEESLYGRRRLGSAYAWVKL